jgi:hypothetical protein
LDIAYTLPGQIPVDYTRAQRRSVPFVVPGSYRDVPVLDEDVPMSSARRVSVPDTEQLGAPRRLASGDMDEDQKLFAKPNDRLYVSSYAILVGKGLCAPRLLLIGRELVFWPSAILASKRFKSTSTSGKENAIEKRKTIVL